MAEITVEIITTINTVTESTGAVSHWSCEGIILLTVFDCTNLPLCIIINIQVGVTKN